MADHENDEFGEVEIKMIAEQQIASLQQSKSDLLAEHTASFKWLMASLLAINAGGLAALSGMNLSGLWEVISAAAFYFGIAFALLVAVFGQTANRGFIPKLEELTIFWILASKAGEFDTEKFNELNESIQSLVKKAYRPRAFGWLSFIAFSIGILGIGLADMTLEGEERLSVERIDGPN